MIKQVEQSHHPEHAPERASERLPEQAPEQTRIQPPAPTGPSPERRSRWGTPVMIVAGGLGLWVLAAGAALVANLVQMATAFDQPAAGLTVTYLLHAPATLLALGGLVMLTVGAVRWAIYGPTSTGVPARPDDQQMLKLLRAMNQRLLLSETAKRIAYREQDLQALRQTIEKDIAIGHFDAAMVLVAELAQTYGYRQEAETYREHIHAARNAEQASRISQHLAELEEMLARHDFDGAAKHAAKLQRLFPDSDRVRGVHQRVAHAREQYKHELERAFLEASQRDEVDHALGLLKELDKYLTEQEAEPLRETARGVIGQKRDNLGVQFKMAVHDKEWTQAVRVGEQIIREFPNTRMAGEVRGMIDVLRERAAGQQAVHAL